MGRKGEIMVIGEGAIYGQSGMVLSRHGLGSALDVKHLDGKKFGVNSHNPPMVWATLENVGQMSVFKTFFFAA